MGNDVVLGDLVIVRGTDWISKAIEEVTHSAYSHVAGVATYTEGKELVEAEGWKKTGFQALDFYKGKADVFGFDASLAQRRVLANLAINDVGGRYDYLLILWELLRYTLNITFPYKEGLHARICSVLWARNLRKVGIPVCKGIIYPSPADLVKDPLIRFKFSLP